MNIIKHKISQQMNKQGKCFSKTKQGCSMTIQPSLIIKLHISPTTQTQINLSTHSDIDSIIHECIVKYKLKKQAHLFLKHQILKSIKKSQPRQMMQRCKNNLSLHEGSNKSSRKNSISNKQMNIKNIKNGDISQNKISFQRTPKKIENLPSKKQASKYQTESSDHRKIQVKIKNISEKQNSYHSQMENTSLCQLKNHQNNWFSVGKTEPVRKNKKKQSIVTNAEDIEKQIASFLEQGKFRSVQEHDNNSRGIQEINLMDLENQMNTQVIDLKYEKRVKNLQFQLNNVFNEIIRFNPPNINRIDPRYADFESLPQTVIEALHQFLVALQDSELNELDFNNFKKLLIKYRGDTLLKTLK